MKFFFAPSTEYVLLHEEHHDGASGRTHRLTSRHRTIFVALLAGCTIAAALSIGFILGQLVSWQDPAIRVSLVSKTFKYNRDFSYPPSNSTNAAWDSLFPKNGGFFSHPPAVPERSTLSVFHQLHCLDAIRHAYWQLHDAATEGRMIADEDIPMHTSPSHIRHCTDLLRQSLMCAADRTLEVKDDKGGVSGFGTVHQCYEYRELVNTVERWQ